MIIATCGLPGSGKSYWARAMATTKEIPYFNPDLFCEAIFNKPYNPEVNVKEYVLDFVEMWKKKNNPCTIVVDATFTTKKARQALMDRFPNDNIEWHFFDTPVEVCLQRDGLRKNMVGHTCISGMNSYLVKPTKEEVRNLIIHHHI